MMKKIVALIGSISLLALIAFQADAANNQTGTNDNAVLIQQAFDNWRLGHGSVFDLLSEQVQWTVAGVSPVSGTYSNKKDFVERAVNPITAQLATAITPTVTQMVAQGNSVVVFWEGRASTQDGSVYKNSYAWHLVLNEGEVIEVVAYLDTWALVELMR